MDLVSELFCQTTSQGQDWTLILKLKRSRKNEKNHHQSFIFVCRFFAPSPPVTEILLIKEVMTSASSVVAPALNAVVCCSHRLCVIQTISVLCLSISAKVRDRHVLKGIDSLLVQHREFGKYVKGEPGTMGRLVELILRDAVMFSQIK